MYFRHMYIHTHFSIQIGTFHYTLRVTSVIEESNLNAEMITCMSSNDHHTSYIIDTTGKTGMPDARHQQ